MHAGADERDADRRHRRRSRSGNGSAGSIARRRGGDGACRWPGRSTNIAGWVARSVTSIFENIGTVQDGMRSIACRGRCPTRRTRANCRSTGGEIRFEDVHFDYGRVRRHRRSRRRAARHRPDHRAGRARRAGRPVGRRQIDPGQPAAAFLRPASGPHPDRRPGHRRRHAGEPARADRHGDAGHLAAAPLDPRQHPLRPAARRPRR